MQNIVLSMLFLLLLSLSAGAAGTENALPEYDIRAFCTQEAGSSEGMWRHECRSAEEDCLMALRLLPSEQLKKRASCEQAMLKKGSYCALLLCIAPETEAARDGLRVIPGLRPEK